MQRVLISFVVFAGMAAACDRGAPAADAPARADESAPSRPAVEGAVAQPTTTQLAPDTDFRRQFVAAAKTIGPAVVSITSTSTVARPSRFEGFPFDLFNRGAPGGAPGTVRRGLGSGVIVDSQGHVLTNNHVIAGADQVKVTLAGDQEVTARLVGTDPKTDLAVVKIEPGEVKLTAAALGDSDALEVGEWVIACGSPFGLRQTVSAGIVSAIGRGGMGITEYEDFIQTDAAINPGNSGGPLVDLEGRVVGINTAIASQSGGSSGVGFAIPIAMAKSVLDQLVQHGKVVRGYVGVLIGDVTEELAQSFGFRGDGGALVQDVSPGGPAARAGVRPGDIVFERDGRPVEGSDSFRNQIADTPPGTRVQLKVWRDGKAIELPVTLGELPDSNAAAQLGRRPDVEEEERWGISIVDITPELARRLGVPVSDGVLIQHVVPGSLAERAGLQPGDVIVAIGDEPIDSAARARARLLRSDGPLRLRVVREGHGLFVMLPKRD